MLSGSLRQQTTRVLGATKSKAVIIGDLNDNVNAIPQKLSDGFFGTAGRASSRGFSPEAHIGLPIVEFNRATIASPPSSYVSSYGNQSHGYHTVAGHGGYASHYAPGMGTTISSTMMGAMVAPTTSWGWSNIYHAPSSTYANNYPTSSYVERSYDRFQEVLHDQSKSSNSATTSATPIMIGVAAASLGAAKLYSNPKRRVSFAPGEFQTTPVSYEPATTATTRPSHDASRAGPVSYEPAYVDNHGVKSSIVSHKLQKPQHDRANAYKAAIHSCSYDIPVEKTVTMEVGLFEKESHSEHSTRPGTPYHPSTPHHSIERSNQTVVGNEFGNSIGILDESSHNNILDKSGHSAGIERTQGSDFTPMTEHSPAPSNSSPFPVYSMALLSQMGKLLPKNEKLNGDPSMHWTTILKKDLCGSISGYVERSKKTCHGQFFKRNRTQGELNGRWR